MCIRDRLFFSKGSFSNRNMNNIGLIQSVFNFTGFDIVNSLGYIHCYGTGLRAVSYTHLDVYKRQV